MPLPERLVLGQRPVSRGLAGCGATHRRGNRPASSGRGFYEYQAAEGTASDLLDTSVEGPAVGIRDTIDATEPIEKSPA